MNNLRISHKIALILLIFVIIPNLLGIIYLDSGKPQTAEIILSIYSITLLILLIPTAKFIAYFIINKDLKKINILFHNVKSSNYSGHFTLPHEKPDENGIIRLKRNINWMLHTVATREDVLHNILKKEKTSKNLFKEQSYIDSLTHVYNRRYFDESITTLFNAACLKRCSIALLMIDCDNFKDVNDSYGHQAGDNILILLGTLLQSIVRKPEDCPFRYGGDEFGLILLNTPHNRLKKIAEDLSINFRKNNNYNTTLSIGIAECAAENVGSTNPERLKQLADNTLYKSKDKGRDCISFGQIQQT